MEVVRTVGKLFLGWLVGNALWTYVYSPIAGAIGSALVWYYRKQLGQALPKGASLSGAQQWLVGLQVQWVLILAFLIVASCVLLLHAAYLAIKYLLGRKRSKSKVEPIAAGGGPGFAAFFAEIIDLQLPDPPSAPDLFAVLILQIGNNGAPSVCGAFRASATTTYGAAIEATVVSNDGFRLYVNGGRDCYHYLPEHFIVNRTRLEEVRRGKPVDGVLPVVFKGVDDPKQIDWRSVQIEFCDAIGDENGEKRWWRIPSMDAKIWKQVETQRYRPGLPSLESPCSEGTFGQAALRAQEQPALISEEPITLRRAARLLAKDIRDFLEQLPAEEAKGYVPLQQRFIDRFMPRYKKIKERLEAELPNFTVKSWAHEWPYKVENIQKIADDLDENARRVAEDALL